MAMCRRILALALLAAALGQPARAATTPGPTEPCRIEGVATELRCGRLQRPLDPGQPQGRQISVHYLVVPAMARNKQPDPVLLLAGGPGQSAIEIAGRVLPRLARLNNRRDLVFIDQRGTGRSAPLQCADDSRLAMAEALDPQAQQRRLAQCLIELQKLPHGDLRFYTTTIAMQDFDAVREQLGAAQWNLVGASYGTRAALEYQRLFPQRVRRTVLDGMAPPDMALPASFSTDGQAALDAVFKACEDEAACKTAFPRLRQDWATLLQGLPRQVVLAHPLSGAPERLTITRELLMRAVRAPMYVPAYAAGLPAAINAAAGGRFEAISGLSGALGSSRSGKLAMGMHLSVICSEDLPRLERTADAPGADFGRIDAEFYRQACAQWPRGTVAEAFYRVGAAPAPVLLLSGGADPVTPPRHGERIAGALGPKARHLQVPAAGHGVLSIACMGELLHRFINSKTEAEALAVEAACAAKMPRPTAVFPIQTATR
ncbi:alpha/beta hydrolase [Roseateles cavernae]|uniref:alpha/beta hydrolase n=1 Tax=Roseateles cavernae TaxID=3153578 RepID=UPI0032E50C4A